MIIMRQVPRVIKTKEVGQNITPEFRAIIRSNNQE